MCAAIMGYVNVGCTDEIKMMRPGGVLNELETEWKENAKETKQRIAIVVRIAPDTTNCWSRCNNQFLICTSKLPLSR